MDALQNFGLCPALLQKVTLRYIGLLGWFFFQVLVPPNRAHLRYGFLGIFKRFILVTKRKIKSARSMYRLNYSCYTVQYPGIP